MNKASTTKTTPGTSRLIDDVLTTLEAARGPFARPATTHPAPLYWRIGKCIYDAVRGNLRSSKAVTMINATSRNLVDQYGDEFVPTALTRMTQFVASFPDYETVITLSKNLTWKHFDALIDVDDDRKRDFYAWMCLVKKWNVGTLRKKISAELYERTSHADRQAAASKGEPSLEEFESQLMNALVSRDPKILKYLGIDDA